MLCQKCQQKNANINMRMVVNGKETQLQLCQTCYQSEKQKIATNFGPHFGHMGGFSGLDQMPLDDLFKNIQGNSFY